MAEYEPRQFWRDVFAIEQSESPSVMARVAEFGLLAALVCLIDHSIPQELGIDVAPYEVAGAALGLLLVLRTNSGYERWWEARRLWGASSTSAATWRSRRWRTARPTRNGGRR